MWVLVLVVGGGYGITQIGGFTSHAFCEAGYQVVVDEQTKMVARGYSRGDVQRSSVSDHYCVEVK
jgi:hypothetical protein